MERPYYGQIAVGGVGYIVEGDGAADLLISRLSGPAETEPVAVITGRDRDFGHELVGDVPAEVRKEIVVAALTHYRLWMVEHDLQYRPKD